tara:strand:- start:304 stop:576 length:273 start_codon:yes stop_codon:yes gene_type:complete
VHFYSAFPNKNFFYAFDHQMLIMTIVTAVTGFVNNSVDDDFSDVFDHPRTIAKQLENEWPTPAPWPLDVPRRRGAWQRQFIPAKLLAVSS